MEKRKVNIALFKYVDEEDSSRDEALKNLMPGLERYAAAVKDFYRHQCRHIWDIEVKPFIMFGAADSIYPPTFARATREEMEANGELNGYDYNYACILGGVKEGICGQGQCPGGANITYHGNNCGVRTTNHELGHNFGLLHSNTVDSSGNYTEYGDATTIMGSKYRVAGFNGQQRIFLGIDGEDVIARPKDSGQYLLCPVELQKPAMHKEEVKHVVFDSIPRSVGVEAVNEFYLFTRKNTNGTHYSGGSGGTVYVVERTKRNASVLHEDLCLKPGESCTLPNGYEIQYLEYKNETSRISVNAPDDDNYVRPVVIPEGFPMNLPSVELSEKHTGAWYNPDFNGQGFDVIVTEDTLVVYWYTFNKEDNSRRFYFGTCKLAEGIEEFEMFTMRRGTWEHPEYSYPTRVGRAQIYFLDDNTGVFNYNFNEKLAEDARFGRGSVQIQPVAKADDDENRGAFYQPERDGEGFTVQYYNEGETCVAYWYTYGPNPIGGGNGMHTQRWYYCVGQRIGDGYYDLEIFEILDGNWMKLKDEPNGLPVGAAELNILDKDNITFSFNIDANNRVKGQGTYNLERLL